LAVEVDNFDREFHTQASHTATYSPRICRYWLHR